MKAPEITPLATAVGKMKCASFVIGVDKTTKSTGGMTSLNLSGVSALRIYLPRGLFLPVHREIVVNPMHQKVDHQRIWVVRQESVDVEQESVEDILQNGPHEVAEDERRDDICKGFRGDATSLQGRDRSPRVNGERRKRICAIRELSQGTQADIARDRQPYGGHDVPSCPREDLRRALS